MCSVHEQLSREMEALKTVTASAVAKERDEKRRLQQEIDHLKEQLEWWQSQARINATAAKSAVEAW